MSAASCAPNNQRGEGAGDSALPAIPTMLEHMPVSTDLLRGLALDVVAALIGLFAGLAVLDVLYPRRRIK